MTKWTIPDAPSPEAIVRAALERAADEANKVSDQYDSHPDGDGTDFAIGAHDAASHPTPQRWRRSSRRQQENAMTDKLHEAIVRAAWKLADAVQIDGDCNGVSEETWAALARFRAIAEGMTRLEALIELRDKVLDGGIVQLFLFQDVFNDQQSHENCAGEAYEAFIGSLDAAKALHEAVLPSWGWDVSNVGACDLDCYKTGLKVETVSLIDNPARAWLLAILEALIAQEGQP